MELRFWSMIALILNIENVPDSAPPDDLTRMNVFDVVGRLVVAIALIHKPRVGSALNAVRIMNSSPRRQNARGNLEMKLKNEF